ncbi:MAG: deoxyribose-phosphate aldolase [Candidatus Azobacteroides pseudotrichonymphae]|jgi:deoxyribose-phosphate aldolase|uniref:Deoxyribose-phosphate aldolase n=1 Tax=Azobacteroides pseudotrichonymphae genomovar. CFP2 TaxID=511995 RepID=B6YRJ6_AZOPC|nr:deoxyribose-phosphate aldolase [Candidatus Azobacteroides pseudotrichonymphae]MDR0530179.1 deoxyribose-phosphate aldolase [Bacteroidales bacterium OttesenSCG-928-I14]BAG83818.1 deoxyribose-phosphate aldolase [Candidatus Azobacteroides pseudotrichonymphae genomovar. CFP2]GMO35550.1 MAG: deoxyribose-phosphate aldolase [Candidatus Azobacteroides pseudotrichonymphae]
MKEIFKKFDMALCRGDINRKTAEIIMNWEKNDTPEIWRLLYSCIDVTSLNTGDSDENIWAMVEKVNEFDNIYSDMNNVSSICVYPNFVKTVKEMLRTNVKITSVAGGFPSSQTFMEIKIAEISLAIADGADELDVVMNCSKFFERNFQEVYEEIAEIKNVCGDTRLKIILETGLLKEFSDIRKAAILSMCAGADFIKTSTGKIYAGAKPESVYVMCEAIKEYYEQYHKKVGLKVSGGICTTQEAVKYYTLVKEILGMEYLTPEYFRIGSSSLSDNILQILQEVD